MVASSFFLFLVARFIFKTRVYLLSPLATSLLFSAGLRFVVCENTRMCYVSVCVCVLCVYVFFFFLAVLVLFFKEFCVCLFVGWLLQRVVAVSVVDFFICNFTFE